MKKTLFLAVGLFSIITFAQVGINTDTPQATLDIKKKTNDGSKKEGIILPKQSKQALSDLQTKHNLTPEEGTIVYVDEIGIPYDIETNDPIIYGSTVANVYEIGHYIFENNTWNKIKTKKQPKTEYICNEFNVGQILKSQDGYFKCVKENDQTFFRYNGFIEMGFGEASTLNTWGNYSTYEIKAFLDKNGRDQNYFNEDGVKVFFPETNILKNLTRVHVDVGGGGSIVYTFSHYKNSETDFFPYNPHMNNAFYAAYIYDLPENLFYFFVQNGIVKVHIEE